MPEFQRYPSEAWLPIAAGLFWLWSAPGAGYLAAALAVVPGALLLAAGVALLLWPGDGRITQHAAAGGLLGVLAVLPACFAFGVLHALALGVASAAGFVAAGHHATRFEPSLADVPAPEPSLALSAQVAVDEVLLSNMTLSLALPRRADQRRFDAECAEAEALWAQQGWDREPTKYHGSPPALEAPAFQTRRRHGIEFEHLHFESGYEPRAEEPGRERWLSYAPNRTAHAWVIRHRDDRPRSWLLGIHGYQMGWAGVDLLAFEPRWLHERLGFNLLLPVLPLHGARAVGKRSGDGFLGGDVIDTVHAEAQAMWDIRRLLTWARAEGAERIGVLGYSLGGYNTALLAGLEGDLTCTIAGIPATDFSTLLARHAPPLHLRELRHAGLSEERARAVLRVVSPLALPPQVPRERRALFGGVADRIVPAEQVRNLWQHWEQPRITWYQGAHVTFRAHPQVRRMVEDVFRETGLAGA